MAANKLNSRRDTTTGRGAAAAIVGGVGIILLALIGVVGAPGSRAQSPAQSAASEKIPDYEYDIVSIKPTDPDYGTNRESDTDWESYIPPTGSMRKACGCGG